MMAEYINDWSHWSPMAEEFNDASANVYETVNETTAKDETKKDKKTKQTKYPYLVVKKDSLFITEHLLRAFFRDIIIYNIEYRHSSHIYLVFFENLGSLEAAWTRIHQFPDIINCVDGRAKKIQNENLLPFPINEPQDDNNSLIAINTAQDTINLESRRIQVSAEMNKHPEYLKSPIVYKADYAAKNSLLALNDINERYLNVKYEFSLERHALAKEKSKFEFRSGRLITYHEMQVESNTSDAESKLMQVAKKCLACNCYTDISCKFCQMYFCNPVCFDALSAAHKESCDKGRPPVVNYTIVSQFSKLQLPPSGSLVKITSFEQTNVLYVRSAEIAAEVAYFKLLSDVILRGKLSAKLSTMPQCGQLVIYKFNSEIVRAMVLNIDDPLAIYLVCVDFGSVEITTLEHLYECSAYLAALPRYAIPVLLRGTPRRFMTPKLREMLYELDSAHSFVLKYSKREYDFSKSMQRVSLIESDLNRSLNRLINTMLMPVEPCLREDGYQENYLHHVPLPTGKNIDVVVMDNSFLECGIVHCTILDFAYDITQMQRDIQYYGDSIAKTKFYAPTQNCLCIAKYLGNWCRGLCMELVGDGFPSILFIDYGNITPIHVDDIRPYPPQFTFPIMTTEYELLGLPADLSNDLLARLKKHLALGAIVNCDEVIYNELDNNYSLRIDVEKL